MTPTAYIRIAIIIGLLTAGFGMGWKLRDMQQDGRDLAALTQQVEALADRDKQLNDLRIKVANQARALELARDNIRTEVEYVTNTIVREVASDPVYGSCVVPDNGVRALSEARDRLNAARRSGGAGEPAAPVPRD